jgi:hypothetical protein
VTAGGSRYRTPLKVLRACDQVALPVVGDSDPGEEFLEPRRLAGTPIPGGGNVRALSYSMTRLNVRTVRCHAGIR